MPTRQSAQFAEQTGKASLAGEGFELRKLNKVEVYLTKNPNQFVESKKLVPEANGEKQREATNGNEQSQSKFPKSSLLS